MPAELAVRNVMFVLRRSTPNSKRVKLSHRMNLLNGELTVFQENSRVSSDSYMTFEHAVLCMKLAMIVDVKVLSCKLGVFADECTSSRNSNNIVTLGTNSAILKVKMP